MTFVMEVKSSSRPEKEAWCLSLSRTFSLGIGSTGDQTCDGLLSRRTGKSPGALRVREFWARTSDLKWLFSFVVRKSIKVTAKRRKMIIKTRKMITKRRPVYTWNKHSHVRHFTSGIRMRVEWPLHWIFAFVNWQVCHFLLQRPNV